MPDTHLTDLARLDATTPLFTGPNWDYASLRQTYDAIERIPLDELGLDVNPVQVEVITSEQMLDAYASVGLPLMYRHWSFGKRFAFHETLYRKGLQGLAYEIVINSNPCICYIMEENSMTMQTLVMAHAAFGHNHFFKNNYVFKQWTDADGILDYLEFARGYIAQCEERYGEAPVERLLDAAHALMSHGVRRYPRRECHQRVEEWQAGAPLGRPPSYEVQLRAARDGALAVVLAREAADECRGLARLPAAAFDRVDQLVHGRLVVGRRQNHTPARRGPERVLLEQSRLPAALRAEQQVPPAVFRRGT